jgi:hypothetical protein
LRTYTNLLHVPVASRPGIVVYSFRFPVKRWTSKSILTSGTKLQRYPYPPPPNPGQVPNWTQPNQTQLNSTQLSPLLEETLPLVKCLLAEAESLKRISIGICYTMMLYTLSLDPREFDLEMMTSPTKQIGTNYYHHVSLSPASIRRAVFWRYAMKMVQKNFIPSRLTYGEKNQPCLFCSFRLGLEYNIV